MFMRPFVKYDPLSSSSNSDGTKGDDDPEDLCKSQDVSRSSKSRFIIIQALKILGSLFALIFYTWIVLIYAREVIYKPFCPRLIAPDNLHNEVRYNPQLVNPITPDKHHPLLGEPSREVDSNWSDLLSAFRNSIPISEVKRLGMEATSVPLEVEGEHYLGGLAMVHNLHCINYLYQVAHRDYYYTPNTTEKEDATRKSHTAHCLHHIMESVKCQADLTPVLLHWTLEDFHSVINWNGVERTCADWTQLMDWEMRHPIYGNFLDENGDFHYVDQEGQVNFEEFSKTSEYEKWAREEGIGTDEAAAEDYIRSFYVANSI